MIRFLSRLKKPRPTCYANAHRSGLSSLLLYVKLSLLYPTPSPTVEASWSATHLVCPRRTDGGAPSFCLSRLSHRRSPTFKTSLVSDTIVRKGAVLRQLMRERPKSSSTKVPIKQKLLSVFYPLTNYTYSVSEIRMVVKAFPKSLISLTFLAAFGLML